MDIWRGVSIHQSTSSTYEYVGSFPFSVGKPVRKFQHLQGSILTQSVHCTRKEICDFLQEVVIMTRIQACNKIRFAVASATSFSSVFQYGEYLVCIIGRKLQNARVHYAVTEPCLFLSQRRHVCLISLCCNGSKQTDVFSMQSTCKPPPTPPIHL